MRKPAGAFTASKKIINGIPVAMPKRIKLWNHPAAFICRVRFWPGGAWARPVPLAFRPGVGNFLAALSSTSPQSLPMPLDGGVNVRILVLAKVSDRLALTVRGSCHHATSFLLERLLVCSLNGSLSAAQM